MSKKIISILTLIIMIFSFSLSIGAKDSYIHDKANLLSPSEISKLETKAESVYKNTGAKIYIVTVDQNYYEGETFLSTNNISKNSNVILLVINSYENPTIYYDIYTYGDADSEITDKEIEYLVHHEEIYDNLKGHYLFDGANAFLTYAEEAYVKVPHQLVVRTIWISIAIGFVIAAITVGTIIFLYKRKLKSAKYPLDKYAKLNLTDQNDIFLGSSVTKTKINTSSSSSGGGGGSGHGGGGGHRGGA